MTKKRFPRGYTTLLRGAAWAEINDSVSRAPENVQWARPGNHSECSSIQTRKPLKKHYDCFLCNSVLKCKLCRQQYCASVSKYWAPLSQLTVWSAVTANPSLAPDLMGHLICRMCRLLWGVPILYLHGSPTLPCAHFTVLYYRFLFTSFPWTLSEQPTAPCLRVGGLHLCWAPGVRLWHDCVFLFPWLLWL